jgi:hypothetical protein
MVDAATGTPKPSQNGVRIVGLKDISAHLGGIHPDTVAAYGRLAEDPLPIRTNTRTGAIWCWSLFLDQWKARRCGGIMPDGSPLLRVDGWVDIGTALGGADRNTALRWAKRTHDRLPVYGIKSGEPGGSRPWAYLAAIRDWLARGDAPYREAGGSAEGWSPVRALAVQSSDACDDE